jgi:acyl-CoA synthetase (NDP forming)
MTAATQKRTGASSQDTVRRLLDKAKSEGRDSLTAPEAKELCDLYGIPVPQEGLATSADEAVKLAEGMGFPVVLKIVSPQILHKSRSFTRPRPAACWSA